MGRKGITRTFSDEQKRHKYDKNEYVNALDRAERI